MSTTRLAVWLAMLTVGFILWMYPWSISPDIGALLVFCGGIMANRSSPRLSWPAERRDIIVVMILVCALIGFGIYGKYFASNPAAEPWAHCPRHAVFAIPLWGFCTWMICRRWRRSRQDIESHDSVCQTSRV